MVCDLRNLQTTNDVPDVTNIPFWVLQVKNEVAAKIVEFICRCCGQSQGGLPYKSEGDSRRKIRIKLLGQANVAVAQEELKEISGRSASRLFFANFFMHSPNRYLNEHI